MHVIKCIRVTLLQFTRISSRKYLVEVNSKKPMPLLAMLNIAAPMNLKIGWGRRKHFSLKYTKWF